MRLPVDPPCTAPIPDLRCLIHTGYDHRARSILWVMNFTLLHHMQRFAPTRASKSMLMQCTTTYSCKQCSHVQDLNGLRNARQEQAQSGMVQLPAPCTTLSEVTCCSREALHAPGSKDLSPSISASPVCGLSLQSKNRACKSTEANRLGVGCL